MTFSDGVFTKRIIPHFTLIAVYAGTRLNQSSYDALFGKIFPNLYYWYL